MIEVRDLTKHFGAFTALCEVSLKVDRGEIIALLGPNGAGKSTLIRCILGITDYEGEIRVDGLDPLRDGKEVRRRTGYMSQQGGLHADLTVGETIRFYAEIRGVDPARARELLAEVAMDSWLRKKIGELSGGMRQRVAFAIACLGNPKVLLLDEPAASIDRESRALLHGRLTQLAAAGVAIVLSTHAEAQVSELVTRSVHLLDGRLVDAVELAGGVA